MFFIWEARFDFGNSEKFMNKAMEWSVFLNDAYAICMRPQHFVLHRSACSSKKDPIRVLSGSVSVLI